MIHSKTLFKVKKSYLIALLAIFCLNAFFASSNTEGAKDQAKEKEFDVNGMIMHHIKDAHEWHLWGGEHDGTSIYLPIILIDGGLKTFSSSHFYHGNIVPVIDENREIYILFLTDKLVSAANTIRAPSNNA